MEADVKKRVRKCFRWDPAVIKVYHTRFMAGEDLKSLGAEAGVTGQALRCQFHKFGFGSKAKHHWWTKKEVHDVIKRMSTGESPQQVAQSMGITPHALRRAVNKYGGGVEANNFVDIRLYRRIEKIGGKILILRRKGFAYKTICDKIGWGHTRSDFKRVASYLEITCKALDLPVPKPRTVIMPGGKTRLVAYSSAPMSKTPKV